MFLLATAQQEMVTDVQVCLLLYVALLGVIHGMLCFLYVLGALCVAIIVLSSLT